MTNQLYIQYIIVYQYIHSTSSDPIWNSYLRYGVSNPNVDSRIGFPILSCCNVIPNISSKCSLQAIFVCTAKSSHGPKKKNAPWIRLTRRVFGPGKVESVGQLFLGTCHICHHQNTHNFKNRAPCFHHGVLIDFWAPEFAAPPIDLVRNGIG